MEKEHLLILEPLFFTLITKFTSTNKFFHLLNIYFFNSAITEHIGEVCANSYKCQAAIHATKCFMYSSDKFANKQEFFNLFPTLEFMMDDDFVMEWKPEDYLYTFGTNKDLYCLPIEKLEYQSII